MIGCGPSMALALTSFGSVDSLHPCSSPCGPTRYARVSKSAVLPICRAPNRQSCRFVTRIGSGRFSPSLRSGRLTRCIPAARPSGTLVTLACPNRLCCRFVASLAGFAGWSAAHGEIPLQLDGRAYLLRWPPHGITYYSILGAISIVHFSHRYFGVLSRSM